MNKNTIQAGFFGKLNGGPWAERLAKLKLRGKKPKPAATAKLEIDDATGETLIFPNIGDVSEIDQDVEVTATDGKHVFTVDGSVYTIEVVAGKVTHVVEDQTGEDEPDPEAMNAETAEFIEAVASELAVNEGFRTTAQASIDQVIADNAALREEIKKLKGLMKHGGDGTGDGDDQDEKTTIKVAGKTIDLKKINLK